MKQNTHTVDRFARIIVAVVVAGLYFADVISGTTGLLLLAIGAVLAVTGAVGFCPIYAALKISTKRS